MKNYAFYNFLRHFKHLFTAHQLKNDGDFQKSYEKTICFNDVFFNYELWAVSYELWAWDANAKEKYTLLINVEGK